MIRLTFHGVVVMVAAVFVAIAYAKRVSAHGQQHLLPTEGSHE